MLTLMPLTDIPSRKNYPEYGGPIPSSTSPSTRCPRRATTSGHPKRRLSFVSPSLFFSCSVTNGAFCFAFVRLQCAWDVKDGTTSTNDMSNKWSTNSRTWAGGEPWKAYKRATLTVCHPVLPGEEKERVAQTTVMQSQHSKNPLLQRTPRYRVKTCSAHGVDTPFFDIVLKFSYALP